MCAGIGDLPTRKFALEVLPDVARIGTHLFHFLKYVENFRGWGRGLRSGIANWYNDKDANQLAYQLVKYQQRDGWSHRDALRLSHPIPETTQHSVLYYWVTQGTIKTGVTVDDVPMLLEAVLAARKAESVNEIITLIEKFSLPREVIPTEFLNYAGVWEALLSKMPLTAMIRNLGKMTSLGLFDNWSYNVDTVLSQLNNLNILKKARVHPLNILVALNTYASSTGVKGSLNWQPNKDIVNALDKAFYLSFGAVEPANKRTMLALDVSDSMNMGLIAGMAGITPRVGSAAMALVTANVEPRYVTTIFSNAGQNFFHTSNSNKNSTWYGITGISEFPLSPRQRLDDVIRSVSNLNFGGTDCALPMLYADHHGLEIDTFVIYTDNETWAGNIHPVQALQEYRRQSGINAKLVVVGMTATGFSIADPDDVGMLDVVGFDTATPQLITEFSKGSLIHEQ